MEKFKSYNKVIDQNIINNSYASESKFMEIYSIYEYCLKNDGDEDSCDPFNLNIQEFQKLTELVKLAFGSEQQYSEFEINSNQIYGQMIQLYDKIDIQAFYHSVIIMLSIVETLEFDQKDDLMMQKFECLLDAFRKITDK